MFPVNHTGTEITLATHRGIDFLKIPVHTKFVLGQFSHCINLPFRSKFLTQVSCHLFGKSGTKTCFLYQVPVEFPGFHLEDFLSVFHIEVSDSLYVSVFTKSLVAVSRINGTVVFLSHQFNRIGKGTVLISAPYNLLRHQRLHRSHICNMQQQVIPRSYRFMQQSSVFQEMEQDLVLSAFISVSMFYNPEEFLEFFVVSEFIV